MNENKAYSLLNVLNNIMKIDPHLTLYLHESPPFTHDSLCALFDADTEEIAEDGTELGFPVENDPTKRWRYELCVKDTVGIFRNALQQKPYLSDDEKIQAFNYYLERDAYIRFAN